MMLTKSEFEQRILNMFDLVNQAGLEDHQGNLEKARKLREEASDLIGPLWIDLRHCRVWHDLEYIGVNMSNYRCNDDDKPTRTHLCDTVYTTKKSRAEAAVVREKLKKRFQTQQERLGSRIESIGRDIVQRSKRV